MGEFFSAETKPRLVWMEQNQTFSSMYYKYYKVCLKMFGFRLVFDSFSIGHGKLLYSPAWCAYCNNMCQHSPVDSARHGYENLG